MKRETKIKLLILLFVVVFLCIIFFIVSYLNRSDTQVPTEKDPIATPDDDYKTKKPEEKNSKEGDGTWGDIADDEIEKDDIPAPELDPGFVVNEIKLPPPKESSQYYKEQVGSTPGQTSTNDSLAPFSEEQRKIDLRTAEIKLSTCTTRYGQADFCEKIAAPVVDVIKAYPELKDADMGQLFAFQYEMVSKKETGSATGLTEGILPFSVDTIQSGGSIVDTLAHTCYELGTSETGVNIVKIPPSKSGQYCNINTQTSAKRTCAENLADIEKCNAALDTYGTYNDAELNYLKNKYYLELGILTSI